ncbi:TetR/AcrR family transcriptional regulator [Paenibacillus sp. KQZ6P-2]|uniref:TetR/AcrR family transcriptional regulator n=1 Tax=Paenibacillus mangrovi TaxID=2931978 RepID=A0A9X2B2E1_9BACL|nr:TetR/AcrR family transcriptional regulator [Paenibacillus mangrovi]MCJ8011835.1 TetR/AcrR family transcriptional regulator [Paenibacillus mangrovi]
MLKKQRKDELKELIFSTSLQLFKEKGFDGVTVEEITQACGIAKGTFYNYFPKKETILFHLGNYQMEVVHQAISRNSNMTNIKESLLAIFKDLFVYLEENRDLVKVFFFELIHSQMFMEQEGKQIKDFQTALSPIMKEGIIKNELKSHMNPEKLSFLMISIYFQTVIQWLTFPDQDQDLVSMFFDQFEMIWEGIGVNKEEE